MFLFQESRRIVKTAKRLDSDNILAPLKDGFVKHFNLNDADQNYSVGWLVWETAAIKKKKIGRAHV